MLAAGGFQPRSLRCFCKVPPPLPLWAQAGHVPVSQPRGSGSARVPRAECQAAVYSVLGTVCAVISLSSAQAFTAESLVPGVLATGRCPQKQGSPGVPLGAQTLTRPFRFFSRVCSCPVAPRAGPGSHPPPPGPCVTGTPRTPRGTCQPAPAFLPPTPTPVYWNLHQHTSTLCCRCLSVCQGPACPPGPCGPSGLPGTALVPPLGLGLETGIWGKGRARQRSTDSGRLRRTTHQELHVTCRLPSSSESKCWNFVSFIYGKKT